MARRRRSNSIDYLWGVPDFGGGGKKKPPRPTSHQVAEHQGRVPQPGVPSGPRQTVPASPGSPAAHKPVYNPSSRSYVSPSSSTTSLTGDHLLDQIEDILNPGPGAKDIADAASRLGVKPRSGGVLDKASDLLEDAGHEFGKGVKEITEEAGKVARIPEKVAGAKVSGEKVLGTPTAAQLLKAGADHTLRRNQKGKLTVPATRHAARELVQAKAEYKAAARPPHDVGGVPDPELRQAIIKYAPLVDGYARKHYGISGESLLSKDLQGESNFTPGQTSSAGAKEYAQFIQSTRDDFLKRYGVDAYGTKDEQVKAMAMYLGGKTDYTPGLEGYNPGGPGSGGGAEYVDYILGQPAGTPVGAGKPKSLEIIQRLRHAKEQAAKVGITPNPDVSPSGKPDVVYVRADAKGAVEWAEAAVGTQEGSAQQLHWSSIVGGVTDPWCAVFISANLQRRGVELPANVSHSSSFIDPNWKGGTKLPTNDLRKAKPGDILVFDWNFDGETDHTAMYVGGGQMIGGNESDQVQRNEVPTENIVGISRPHYKGGKVAVKSSTPLPGVGPEGGLTTAPAGAAVAVGAAGQPEVQAAPVSGGSVPVSPLISTTAALPEAFQQFQQGGLEALTPEEANDMVAQILRRKRL